MPEEHPQSVLPADSLLSQAEMARELERLQELNRELNVIIDSCHDSIVTVDVVDGEAYLRRINPACERITGLKAGEIIGRRLKDIEKESIVSESVSLKVLEKKQAVSIIQKIKTGREVMYTGTPILGKDGEIKTVVCTGWDLTELNSLRQALLESQEMAQKYRLELAELTKKSMVMERIIFDSESLERIMEIVLRIAPLEVSVLILGESGVGKQLVARIIHDYSKRNKGPFIKVDCGAIPPSLIESELFGFREGSFTGAKKQGKAGILEAAEGGTVFLDEIAELPLAVQPKLLRFLQDSEVQRIGDVKPKVVNVRVLAATNRNLEEMVREGTFREDLFYRLNVVPITIPPLRERREDIVPLTRHFLDECDRRYSLRKVFSSEVMKRFLEYNWPGNIRQLENVIHRMVVVSRDQVVGLEDLPPELSLKKPQTTLQVNLDRTTSLKLALKELEQLMIQKAYLKHHSIYKAAKELGVHPSTVSRKMANPK
ncbi:MAG: sigma 54-interacting transcriptional regulator [Firmicutes bacterium]|nr:sigma 54-interacting transcriptional regulator [Bacillota bacterium]